MMSHYFYYQLALLALVWLFVSLHLTWPKRGVTAPAAPAAPETMPQAPPLHRAQSVRGPDAKAPLRPV
jgi:hypothetical protein